MEKFVVAVQKIVVSHPDTWDEGHIVQFHQMSDSSLDIYMSIYFTTTAYDAWLKARQEVFLAIIKKAEEMGVEFAFPSTSLYVESLPETLDKKEIG
jgi:MscS family membrane protein